jgi:hypothetical protein
MPAETEQQEHGERKADQADHHSDPRDHEQHDDPEDDECECCANHGVRIPRLHGRKRTGRPLARPTDFDDEPLPGRTPGGAGKQAGAGWGPRPPRRC